MAGALGCDHDDIDIGARLDQAKVDVEAMRKGEGRTGLQIGVQVFGIDGGLMLIGRQDHQDVGPLGRFLVAQHLETGTFRLLGGGRTLAQGDGHILHARITQVLRMGVALAAITEDGDLLVGDEVQVGIGVVIDFHWFSP